MTDLEIIARMIIELKNNQIRATHVNAGISPDYGIYYDYDKMRADLDKRFPAVVSDYTEKDETK